MLVQNFFTSLRMIGRFQSPLSEIFWNFRSKYFTARHNGEHSHFHVILAEKGTNMWSIKLTCSSNAGQSKHLYEDNFPSIFFKRLYLSTKSISLKPKSLIGCKIGTSCSTYSSVRLNNSWPTDIMLCDGGSSLYEKKLKLNWQNQTIYNNYSRAT